MIKPQIVNVIVLCVFEDLYIGVIEKIPLES